MPPDSSCGYCRIRVSASGIPTLVSISTPRLAAASSEISSWARMTSITCIPMVKTGLSDVIGSWKIMLISLPRTSRISSHGSLSRSRPLKKTSPATILPGGSGIRRRMLNAVTLFPDPDSPTRPSTSPGRMSRSTPSTALPTPASVQK
jgi:hypothetical protein